MQVKKVAAYSPEITEPLGSTVAMCVYTSHLNELGHGCLTTATTHALHAEVKCFITDVGKDQGFLVVTLDCMNLFI